ncbi:phosphoribosyltransferase family protein [Asticcacaulis sp. BYS171W]|uniref:Phosphoribosyltransferase family protein n=1 Tax=Asticcacaulis aquaticus TaxID=2984212 RepID=A0ABT5HWM9_9CAUL|nr:phosphoribosyltransferase family protein [Asticcacaulis aquaticus]MDC7684384.1 phosphoribosyltransferase family protein [Asticcacaulis aquaticus]
MIVDHAVNGHLVTTVDGNPAFDKIDHLPIYSVFQRLFDSAKASRDRGQKVRGDNFPLIYALKGLDELTIPFSSLKRLNESIPGILAVIEAQLAGQVDVIAPMPSSSTLADMLACRLAYDMKLRYVPRLFSKATNAQAIADIAQVLENDPKSIPRGDEKTVRNVVQHLRDRPEEAFTSKSVQTSVRHYFTPLVLNAVPEDLAADSRFLLVDDLLSTGGTLISADKRLAEAGFGAPRQCVTWFSRAGKKKRV